jgi:hypothetical protein
MPFFEQQRYREQITLKIKKSNITWPTVMSFSYWTGDLLRSHHSLLS